MLALLLTASFSQLFGWGEGLSPSGVRLPLRPPTPGINVEPLSHLPLRYRWRASGALSCPYLDGLEIPLCGQIFDLHLEGGDDSDVTKNVQGRAVLCAKDSVSVAALWNAEIEQDNFPRFQNRREDNEEAYDKLCRAGYAFREWVGQLMHHSEGANKDSEKKGFAMGRLPLNGLDRIPGVPKAVALCNAVQSNFIAPYDFIIVEGKVIRQRYATEGAWSFPEQGTVCWVMQLSGVGDARIVSVCVGKGDKILGQTLEPLLPRGLLAEKIEQAEQIFHPLSAGQPLVPANIVEGISGLPLLLGGKNVCAGMQFRRGTLPLRPNELLWDPANTRAAFSAIASRQGDVFLVSVTAEVTVFELTAILQELGAEDALLLGGSADVNLWVRSDSLRGGRLLHGGNWIYGPARKGGTRRSLFEEGERPLNCVVVAYLR